MPMLYRQETRAVVRRRIGALMGKLVVDTATAGTGDSITFPEVGRYPDNYFRGKSANLVGGAGAGQVRLVTGSVQQDGVAFVTPSWTVAPAAGSVIELWDEDLSPTAVNAAIEQALLEVHDFYQVKAKRSIVTMNSTRTELEIDPDLVRLYKVAYLDNGNWTEYDHAHRLDELRLFDRGWAYADGIVYVQPAVAGGAAQSDVFTFGYILAELPTNDSSLIACPPHYLTYMAAFFLEAKDSEGPALDPEQHAGRAANWLRQALTIRQQMQGQFEPGTINLDG